MNPTDRPPSGPAAAAALDDLERLLRRLLEDHRALLQCIRRKRQAIRGADVTAVADLCRRESALAERIGMGERERRERLAGLAAALGPAPTEPLTMSRVAGLATGEQQGRLLGLTEELRAVVGECREQSSIVKGAADALSRHLNGMMQSMQSALGRAGVYSQRGLVSPGAQLRFTVDVRT